MADGSDEERSNARLHQNQPYDESLEVPDSEEVASNYTPSPRVPVGRGQSRGETPPDFRMSDNSDDDFETGQQDLDAGPPGGAPQAADIVKVGAGSDAERARPTYTDNEDDNDNDEESSEEEDDDEDDEDERGNQLEGAYDPSEFENLPVNSEIKELFQYITRYLPQSIELDSKLRPMIPDYIPAAGDIDAFLKVPRPDKVDDTIGLSVLDEPCAKQSDPTVLDLTLRSISKQKNLKAMVVKSIEGAEKNPKSIDNWIESISELHRSKPPPNVHYTKNMPDIDSLMQEWPPEFEELLKEVGLPTAELDCDLAQYVDMICSILDIPVYKSKIQSLHVLFTLYSEFKNSQHFKALAEENKLDNALKRSGAPVEEEEDRLIL